MQRRRPGELIHVDVEKLGRILKPGHRIDGERRQKSGAKHARKSAWPAGSSRMSRSTITAARPMSRSSPTRRRRQPLGSSTRCRVVRRPRRQCRTSDDRQRLRIRLTPLRPSLPAARTPTPTHTSRPSRTNGKAERSIRPPTRVGLQPRVPDKRTPHRSTLALANPLRLHKTIWRPQPQATRHPTDHAPRRQPVLLSGRRSSRSCGRPAARFIARRRSTVQTRSLYP